MNRFRPLRVLGLIVLGLFLAACSQGESPEKGAQIFWESFAQMDGSKLMERTCRAEQASTATAGTAVQVMLSLFSGDVIGMGSDLKIDVSGLQFRTVSTSGNNATVELSGVLRASMGLAAIPEVTYSTTMQMLREDDRWKLCDSDFWVNNPLAQQPGSGGTVSGGLVGAPVTANAQWTPVVQEVGGVPMVQVPAGCFMMGNNDGNNDAKPVHEQCFEEAFWIGQTEVTNRQYARFIEAGGYTNAAYWTDAGWLWRQDENSTQPGCWTQSAFNQPDQPVVCISWYEAAAYSAWLSASSGQAFRLPTEAEWEYTARGPDGLVYPWGNEWNEDSVVWAGNSGSHAADVGSRPSGASWVGALDMSGNVWEWLSSQFRPYPYSATDGREDLQGDSGRVLRGGSWGDYSSDFFRCDFRSRYSPPGRNYDGGVRLALS